MVKWMPCSETNPGWFSSAGLRLAAKIDTIKATYFGSACRGTSIGPQVFATFCDHPFKGVIMFYFFYFLMCIHAYVYIYMISYILYIPFFWKCVVAVLTHLHWLSFLSHWYMRGTVMLHVFMKTSRKPQEIVINIYQHILAYVSIY